MNTVLNRKPRNPFPIHRSLKSLGAQENERGLHGSGGEETLVVDARAQVRPAQMVEHKLVGLLKSVLIPVSHVRLTAMASSRQHC